GHRAIEAGGLADQEACSPACVSTSASTQSSTMYCCPTTDCPTEASARRSSSLSSSAGSEGLASEERNRPAITRRSIASTACSDWAAPSAAGLSSCTEASHPK